MFTEREMPFRSEHVVALRYCVTYVEPNLSTNPVNYAFEFTHTPSILIFVQPDDFWWWVSIEVARQGDHTSEISFNTVRWIAKSRTV